MSDRTNILTISGYYERYFELRQDSEKDRDAWEKLEKELNDRRWPPRYTSFESFVSAKNRRLRNRRHIKI